ncbi:MAG: Peptidoglycan glycosyltransferase [Candidatus Gottesmanbacteria bacterium GW2011_GWA1_34_13]|uniref:Peptidoglycan glycosyltransferase n=1 Tax=Candidatus Gottesmanbacteria bacterium GW2011_GWA1_34_13 TaxID=1618434 RepID=A0A0G0D7I0_9BACT|nr:MAG: Peptidoglycan glycosyltransferase [Candidatus Gottesmanbacteria bacterium GW2011_GWA1_34_13]
MWRQKFVLLGFIICFSLIICKLFYWQFFKSGELANAASNQYYFKLNLSANRGQIMANDGSVLVTNKTAYLIYAEPKKIEDKNSFSNTVSKILDLDKEIINNRLNQSEIFWVPIKHKVNETTCEELKNLNLKGLGFEKESQRYYPEASLAAQLLGFVGNNESGEDKGYFGIEGFYDLALKGKSGFLIREKDASGNPILLGDEKRIPFEDGQNLELYLDRSVQTIIEDNLKKGIEKYGASEGLVAVMDPITGGIIGMAATPSYDPSKFGEYDAQVYPNPIVANTYEPGSTFKTLVMAAALNEKAVDVQTKFNEEGPIKIGQYYIRTWNDKYNGQLNMSQILEKSSNPGMVFVANKLGKDKFIEYLNKFGIGKKTGIDLEEEATSEIKAKDTWSDIDLATASFGQGIAVTPIQMLQAVASLANKGNLMEPQIVKKISDKNGKVIIKNPKIIGTTVDQKTAKMITDMMVSAVDNGDAKWAKPKGYRIAGKTGTAQIPVAGHYDVQKTIASFVGFAPADKPKFVILVALREPQSSPWGSETAAPLFFNITKELFTYYGISPND